MIAAIFLIACNDIRALAVGWYPQNYEPPVELSIDVEIALSLTAVAEGLNQPTELRFPTSHPEKLIVLEKEGRALVLTRGNDGSYSTPQTLFEIEVNDRSEQGLLGLAFHPNYAQNGTFYVHSTPKSGKRRGGTLWYESWDYKGSAIPRILGRRSFNTAQRSSAFSS